MQSTKSLASNILLGILFIKLNKFGCTPFLNFFHLLVNLQDNKIQNNRHKDGIYQLRQHDMQQVINKLQLPAQEKQEQVHQHAIGKIACGNQRQRQLNVIWEKPFSEKAVHIANAGINHGIKANDAAEENIQQEPTEKPDPHPFLPAAHKPKGRCHDNQEVG